MLQLLMGNTCKNSRIAYLVAVKMKDRKNRTVIFGI